MTMTGKLASCSRDLHATLHLESSWLQCTKLNVEVSVAFATRNYSSLNLHLLRVKKLSKRERSRQEAIWELISTEFQYLKTVRLVIDVSWLSGKITDFSLTFYG